jgi:preprotein translocase subunit SecF
MNFTKIQSSKMSNKLYIVVVFVFASVFQINAQKDSLKTETPVQDEFSALIQESNNYQGYKVVDYDKLIELRNTTRNYITELKEEIIVHKNTVDQQNDEIQKLKSQLESTQEDLNRVSEEKDALMFLGMPFSKAGYKTMMWGIVAALVAVLLILFFRYKSSNAATKDARQKLNETEKEFDAYRTKALEKEQRLGRMLQDERNKTSGNP